MPDSELAQIFAADGPLARALPGYRTRQAQVELAQAIGQAVARRGTLVAEAGTGIGKTWAYLVPAFLAGGKVLVSTGTRTLQDQLYARDLPRVRDALAVPVTAALLKGRGNYVCHYHLERLLGDDRALKSRAEVGQLRRIQVFAQQSRTGDRAELADVPEEADIWQRVTSTRENCLGQDCPRVRDCFVLKARRQAQDADVVVVNHALFLADLVLREEGVTDLLPQADTVIFDEAHQLPDTATRFLGTSVSTHQLLDLARTVEATGLAQARESADWSQAARRLEHLARELRLACAPLERQPGRKATFEAMPEPQGFDAALAELRAGIESVAAMLDGVADRHPDLAAAAREAAELAARLQRWSLPPRGGAGRELGQASGRETRQAAGQPPRQASGFAPAGGLPFDQDAPPPAVRWAELGLHHVRLHAAPLSVAEAFSGYRQPGQAWIFTSATLSVHGDFSHFTSQLGLDGASAQRWESPFDYAAQGLLFVPGDLPAPQAPDFAERFVDTLRPLLEASAGGALVLCTTLRAVEKVAGLLGETRDSQGRARPLLRQGGMPRRQLLERFRDLGNAVLVGSASFWEGVDVPGEALTLVAIDKLPFAPPDDPVLEARLRACRARGGNPFVQYQVPEAAIALKQGAGRLIRTEADWGVLMVGDVRLVDKPYGKRLWRGLPPFSRTRDLAQALAFYRQRQAGAPESGREAGRDEEADGDRGLGADAAGGEPAPATGEAA